MGPGFYPTVLLEPGEDCVADKFLGTQAVVLRKLAGSSGV